jgi:hypothetical protein
MNEETGARGMIRVEGVKAYVANMREAFQACDIPGVQSVVIEDNLERIKLEKIMHGFDRYAGAGE